MSKYQIKIPQDKIADIKIVRAAYYFESITNMKARTGADIIINGGTYDMNTGAPDSYVVIDGKVVGGAGYAGYGYGFNGNKVVFGLKNAMGSPYFAGCYTGYVDNKKIIEKYLESTKRGRTGIGLTAAGELVIYVISDDDAAKCSTTAFHQAMIDYGAVNGINLDGGGSSQWISPTSSYNSGRSVSWYICIWLKTSNVIVLDPGHGGTDDNKGQTGYSEKAGNLKIANYLADILKKSGYDVRLTRTTDDKVGLSTRGAMAKGAALFLSIHSNAANKNARGTECYYSVKQPGNKGNAAMFSKGVSVEMNNPDRGAKTRESTTTPGADYYTAIKSAVEAGCPYVFLCENGFHDNLIDEAFLKIDANLQKIAQALADVIKQIVPIKGSTTAPDDKLYRVQVGAYKIKENADKMLSDLKAKGFNGFVTLG